MHYRRKDGSKKECPLAGSYCGVNQEGFVIYEKKLPLNFVNVKINIYPKFLWANFVLSAMGI